MTLVKNTFNRRSFLKASALAGGGMMLGFNWLASCTPVSKELPLQMPEEWFNINAFLKIGDNGIVTILSPNPEIGQNVKTSMPMIVAEELDVDWKHVIVEQAGLDTQNFRRQIAGGSQSIRKGWQSLRRAGATARAMLLEAAAKQWEVPVTELTTEKGTIQHAKSGQSIGYGEVATLAADISVPEEVQLKDPKDFTIIGTSRKNVDAKKIVTGQPLFGLDVKKEGMLIAMIEHAPAFGMKLKSLDDTAARAMPGIQDIFTINTTPEGVETRWSDITAFPDLVAIVGRSTWEVMKAKKALKIQWETTSKGENTEAQQEALDAVLRTRANEPARKDGNVNQAFSNAAQIIEKSYSAPFLAHNTMEPMNFFAHVTAGKAELEGPIQTPQALRGRVSKVLNMPEDNISIM
ncbi:MAG: molybdopterin cofactor-binding domain-containing protein, partial [Bacteroidota bacterium]